MARIAPILRSFSDRVVVIDDVTEEGWRALQDAGVSRTELERIAGADRVIRGDRELDQLSRLLARVDDICAPAAELPSARVVATLEAVARRTRGMDRAGFLARYATCGFELRELSDAEWAAL